jgi:hypothetical protein
MKNAYNILVRNPEEKRPLGRTRLRWVNDIRMDLKEIGLAIVDWIHLTKYRDQWRPVVDTVMNLWFP